MADWALNGAAIVDTDTLTWSPDISDSTTYIRSPYYADDSVLVVSAGDSAYIELALNSYDVGDRFVFSFIATNDDTIYDATAQLDVLLVNDQWSGRFNSPYKMMNAQTYTIYQVWIDEYFYFRKYGSNKITIAFTKKSGNGDILSSNVSV